MLQVYSLLYKVKGHDGLVESRECSAMQDYLVARVKQTLNSHGYAISKRNHTLDELARVCAEVSQTIAKYQKPKIGDLVSISLESDI
jgi:hypothetical protein